MVRVVQQYMFIPGFAVCGGLVACASTPPPEPEPPVDPALAAATAVTLIDSGEARAHVAFLASDELAGRDTPSPGLEAAAEYIARRFEAVGLEAAGDTASWLQRYPYTAQRFDARKSKLAAQGRAGGASLAFGEQWFAMGVAAGEEDASGQAYYVGHAGSAGFSTELGGKIAVVTLGPGIGMELFQLIRSAAEAEAEALVLVLHPSMPTELVPSLVGQLEGLPPQPLPVAGVLRSAAAELLAVGGLDIDNVAPAEGSGAPDADLGLELAIRVAMQREEHRPPNVVGILRGSDPVLRETYVVYTAHFDHVGVGAPDAEGDSIYNGADDDASGTALLIEVAEAFGALPEPPDRSIVFLAVSGEEKGLLGARFWVENPTVPISGVVANINADMVGRNAPDTLVGIGGEYSTLGSRARHIAEDRPELGLVVVPDPDPSEQAFFRSDHVAFVRARIPAIFFTTWLHEDYHAPSDEVESIDADKLARVSRLAFWLGWELASDPEPPAWNPGAWLEVSRILETSPF